MATASSFGDIIAYKEDRQPIQLMFDIYTPRPHFIALQCEPKQDATTTELQATYEIVGRFLQANPQYDKEAILSFHRGKWYQQHTDKWHAHLCIPKQYYLEQARVHIKKIPQNKQWNGARTVDEGMKAWYTRKIQEYIVYKNLCVKKGIPEQNLIENISLSTFDSNSKEFQLVWTSPAPRIAVIARSPTTSTLASLYTFMSKVRSDAAKELGGCDKTFSNFGCHLCLYVRGQSGTNVTCRKGQILTENGRVIENLNIVGYIQMDECQYVEWLPRNMKHVWLEAFSRVEHYAHT